MSDLYRVAINEKVRPPRMTIMYLGMEVVDDTISGEYYDSELLPEWVKGRLATLSMLSYIPPTENVEGVGRRISKNIYWVQKPD